MKLPGFGRPPVWGWAILLAGYTLGVLLTLLAGLIYAAPYRAEARDWQVAYDSMLTVNAGLLGRAPERVAHR